jgi:hypothetical protein
VRAKGGCRVGKDRQVVKTVIKIIRYIEILLPVIIETIYYLEREKPDEEKERQLGLDFIRAASNAKAREDILSKQSAA